jgi:hypothetical protein
MIPVRDFRVSDKVSLTLTKEPLLIEIPSAIRDGSFTHPIRTI